MVTKETPLNSFVEDLMSRRRRLPSQLAADLAVSPPTAGRWLTGKDVPNTRSCRKLAEYSGVPVEKVLSLAGHMPQVKKTVPSEWPEFREYAHRKYGDELDEDLIIMIEDLIERRRSRKRGKAKP